MVSVFKMTKLPVLSGKELCKALSKLGFNPIRQKGSHVYMQHADGRTTVVPMSPQIGIGLLKRILNETDIDKEEFMKYI